MAKKASDNYKLYVNPDGAVIGTVSRRIITKDGLCFKDIDGSGEFKLFDDWRMSPGERAAAYVEELTLEEKLAQLFISDWRMGKYTDRFPVHKVTLDESGILDDAEFYEKTIFGEQSLPGTTELIKEWFSRHLILRESPTPQDMTDWINQLNAVAEECKHFIPVLIASNSRNENGEMVYGMNDATGVFATWPGTLGIAAAVRGDGLDIIDRFADCIRREWNATGLKKGYMYMADVLTDPRWQRSYGTFGEDDELICKIIERLVVGIQGSDDGVTDSGVAMTVKHFPGGGARENGFDPHYKMGQWNVYQTEDSLKDYHLGGFRKAVEKKVSSIMPYYAKPSADKSAVQHDLKGDPVTMEPYGFAYNRVLIDGLLRNQMGFEGYVNSDTGILHNMNWGVEMLDIPERIGFAVGYAGVDLISGLFDQKEAKEAYERGTNDYYEKHPVPDGFVKEQLVLTDEMIDRAVTRTMTEMFALGLFDNPYRNPDEAALVTGDCRDWNEAMEVHRKSVVLLKNDGILPLTADRLNGKKVYAECFNKDKDRALKETEAIREELRKQVELTDDESKADIAILMVNPSSGEYFSATKGYLELDICEDKEVCDVDDDGRPTDKTHKETTLSNASRIADIARDVHSRGGKVIANINITLAWEPGNVEPHCDALTAGFDTYALAVFDVMFGRYCPTGRLPLTLPKNDEVLKVDEDGRCISRNDVPGYKKDCYMSEHMKDENGKAYAYRDSEGNYYELDYGLSYM